MDKQALRAVVFLLLMFGLVLAMVLAGREVFSLEEGQVANVLAPLRGSIWGLPVTIAVFVLAAFIGAPQWALITAVVLVFGPWQGSLFAWSATMCSAAVDFWIGRAMGAERLRKYGGEMVNRIIAIVRENGFFTSFAVRFVPTGPFILVNMAAGVSRMKFPAFLAGTGLGIITKIAVVALIAQGLITGANGQKAMLGCAGLVIALIGGMLYARRHLRARLSPAAKNNKL